MKIFHILLCFGVFVYGQNGLENNNVASKLEYKNLLYNKFENSKGKLILDTIEIKKRYSELIINLEKYQSKNPIKKTNQTAVNLCSNGGFEEFETTSTGIFLKDYVYFIGKAENPIQCKSLNTAVFQNIKEFNPNDSDLMVRIVPSNIIDKFIGDIKAFDQNCLKINHENSSNNTAVVSTKRFKTDNETLFQFNFKSVLQSIDGDSHVDEQPYFKARAFNKNGIVVSEFCLIADVTNCIFTEAAVLLGESIILYTKNWQSGSLDISSIPNNEEFTIQLISTRCGLEGHFGYTYIDDICVSHNSENLQGSIELDPIYKICPTLPLSICGSFTLPNSGSVPAIIKTLGIKLLDASNNTVYSSIIPASVDLATKRFCFNLVAGNFPDIVTGTYNISANISFEIASSSCTGTVFNDIVDPDANPGWDIWFLNCDPACAISASPATLFECDTDNNSKEIFNLTDANPQLFGSQAGIVVSYFSTLLDATNNTNPILTPGSFESFSTIIFVRMKTTDTCFKIISLKLVVRNPKAYISGILNVCEGSTILTASNGSSYLWNTGQITKSIVVTENGLYTVFVTDSNGCTAEGKVVIIPSTSAPLPSLQTTQPDCFTTTGAITVTSPGAEFSFDGGLTWQTSPTKSNLNYGSYAVQVRTVKGCLSFSSVVRIEPFLTNFPNYSKVDPQSCGGLGSITIVSVGTEYSFDDGLTWSTNNVLNNLGSGTYKIKTKDSNGCISNYNSVLLDGEFLDACEFEFQNPYCGNKGYIIISTPAASYSIDGGTVWQSSNTFMNLSVGSYILKVKNDLGCTSTNKYAYLNLLEQTYPSFTVKEAGCDTYATISIITKGDLYSFDNGITYTSNPILNNQNGITNYKLIVTKGTCISYTTDYTLLSKFIQSPEPNNYQEIICDNLNDNTESLNLNNYTQFLISNSTNYSYDFYETLNNATLNLNKISIPQSFSVTPLNKNIFVRTISFDGCYGISKMTFDMIASPIIDLKDRYPLCEFGDIPIRANDGFDKYEWSTGELTQQITIDKPGNYWLKVYENHSNGLICDSTKNFEVFLSNPAKISEIKFSDWTIQDNTITIIATGLGEYEYSIDGVNFQDSNFFSGIYHGKYTVYVHDKNECGTVTKDVFLMYYPNFFTPNGDSYNDIWKIKYAEKEKDLDTNIFDRNGKLIKNLKFNDPGWDGTFNGQPLPADDYWFVVTRTNGTQYKGHFSLKR